VWSEHQLRRPFFLNRLSMRYDKPKIYLLCVARKKRREGDRPPVKMVPALLHSVSGFSCGNNPLRLIPLLNLFTPTALKIRDRHCLFPEHMSKLFNLFHPLSCSPTHCKCQINNKTMILICKNKRPWLCSKLHVVTICHFLEFPIIKTLPKHIIFALPEIRNKFR